MGLLGCYTLAASLGGSCAQIVGVVFFFFKRIQCGLLVIGLEMFCGFGFSMHSNCRTSIRWFCVQSGYLGLVYLWFLKLQLCRCLCSQVIQSIFAYQIWVPVYRLCCGLLLLFCFCQSSFLQEVLCFFDDLFLFCYCEPLWATRSCFRLVLFFFYNYYDDFNCPGLSLWFLLWLCCFGGV